jgi:hypothetical protein
MVFSVAGSMLNNSFSNAGSENATAPSAKVKVPQVLAGRPSTVTVKYGKFLEYVFFKYEGDGWFLLFLLFYNR